MEKDFISRRPSGSGKNEPKVVSVVMEEFFRSNESLAVAFRDRLFKDFFPDTHLDVDLKLITREPGRMPVGGYLDGAITHDDENHFTFIETPASTDGKRNPHVFEGEFITITRRSDGSLRPNFKLGRIGGRGFNLESYAFGVAYELREALRGLVEENMSE